MAQHFSLISDLRFRGKYSSRGRKRNKIEGNKRRRWKQGRCDKRTTTRQRIDRREGRIGDGVRRGTRVVDSSRMNRKCWLQSWRGDLPEGTAGLESVLGRVHVGHLRRQFGNGKTNKSRSFRP